MTEQTTTATIVVIDDEKRMCDSLTALLSGDGYRVMAFQVSTRAVEAIRQHRVDLVITDIVMPEMDGLEVLKAVKAVDDDIPVVLMTGNASLDSAVQAIGQGAYDYLLKPVEFTHLELTVKRALEKRRSDLERLQLLEELKLANMLQQRRISELNALYEAGKSIGSAANLPELLRQIVTLASSVSDAEIGSIMLLDEKGETLTIAAAIGLDTSIVRATRLVVGDSISGYVAKTGEPLIIEDVETHPQFQRRNKEKYRSSSLLCAPMKIKNKVIGVINMARKVGGGSFNKADLRLLTTFASQAAVAVDDAHQFERNRRRLIEFEILHEVTRELTNMRSINDFRKLLIEKLALVFPIDYSLWLDWNPAQCRLTAAGVSGDANLPLTDSGGIDLNKVSREAISLPDLEFDRFDLHDIPAVSEYLAEQIHANPNLPDPGTARMAIPVIRQGELAYVLYLSASSINAYSDDDRSLARLVVSQAAVLFERERSLLNATRLLTMGNMISEISHDLRKPLTSIKGGLQIMRQKMAEIEHLEAFKLANEEVHRMNELVRELVDFSNPNKYQTEKVDLRHLVERAADLVGPDLRRKNISFSAEYEDVDWECIVNKNQILEAFLNLFLNAADATNDNGSLTVKGLIEQPAHKKEKYLALRISDTGKGISKDNLSRIFERYYTTKDTGTGLGLSVVERIVSAHSGTISVESEPGHGTCFTLYFPLPR
jgi:signal transduction histidine kinase/FixJ family two-component response regulator/putative methionine-R-sulfoxide reductase with GAF domain